MRPALVPSNGNGNHFGKFVAFQVSPFFLERAAVSLGVANLTPIAAPVECPRRLVSFGIALSNCVGEDAALEGCQ